MEFDQDQLLNEYINRQARTISDLTNKNLMLETRLSLAMTKLQELLPKEEETEEVSETKDDY